MDRVLESRLFVGQEVTFDDCGTPRCGFVERIDDSQVPAMVTVRRADGCNGCRVTRAESAFEPASKAQRMVQPRGGIVRGVLVAAALLGLSAEARAAVWFSAVSPDGAWRVELADFDEPGKHEIYATPLAGGARRRISLDLAADRDAIQVAITRDSQRVVYTADATKWTRYELYSVPILGGESVRLSGALPADHVVDTLAVTSSGRVVYRQGRNATGVWQLWSVAVAGGGRLQITNVAAPSMVVQGFHEISGGNVAYPVEANGSRTWWFVPIGGGTPTRGIFFDGFESGSTGGWR